MASRELPWGKLDRRFLAAQSMNGGLPEWVRVAMAAWERVTPSGIARFKPGELAEQAGRVDPVTGEVVPVKNVRRALARAKAEKWLDPESTVEVLRVSGNVFGLGRN